MYLVVNLLEGFNHVDDVLHLGQEPGIDASEGAQPLDGVAGFVIEGCSHGKDPFVSRMRELLGRVEGTKSGG